MKKLINEIRGEDTTELKAKLNDLRKEQFNLRFHGAADAKNTRQREVRRTIARIMMVLGERERTGAGPVPAAKVEAAPATATATVEKAPRKSGKKTSGTKQ